MVTLALGTWVLWPTLQLGLFADDYLAAAMVDGTFAAPRAPLDLFDFADGTPEDVAALQRLGSLPWWTPPDFRVSFVRPLSSALVHLDRALFGDALWLRHAHSIAAWALLVCVVALLYARLLTPWLAALAIAVYGLDDGLHFPTLWLSHRGGLYALAFGLLGVYLHVRGREERRPHMRLASLLPLAVALGFGEWALPAFAYLAAYELAGARDDLRGRAAALAPAATLALAFLIVRAALGYGARSSGAYVDPAQEPLRFLTALLARVPVLTADMLLSVPASWWDHGTPLRDRLLERQLFAPDTWKALPDWRSWHMLLAIAALLSLGALVRFCRRRLPVDEARPLGWLALGGLLALLPVVGSFPSTRLTMGAFVGVAPLLAALMRELARALYRARRPARFAGAYLAMLALLTLTVLHPLSADLRRAVRRYAATTAWVHSAELDPARLQEQRVYLLSSVDFTSTFFFAYVWAHRGEPLPRSFYPLSAAPHAHQITRIDERTLRLSSLGGGMLRSGREAMFRPIDAPPTLGEHVRLPGLEIEVARVVHGYPQSLLLHFDRSVDDPSQVFLVADRRGMSRVRLPAVGESLRLRRAESPSWLQLERAREARVLGPGPEFLRYRPTPEFMDYGG